MPTHALRNAAACDVQRRSPPLNAWSLRRQGQGQGQGPQRQECWRWHTIRARLPTRSRATAEGESRVAGAPDLLAREICSAQDLPGTSVDDLRARWRQQIDALSSTQPADVI
ncbi:MAG: hypothetical protein INR62_12210 [Rhodospirillales bacterium]|nr:hypothetical protein [Acetobacter sp.]